MATSQGHCQLNRRDLKQIRALVATQSNPTKIQGSAASTAVVRAQAAAELSAVSDTYQTAAIAADLIRSHLSRAESPRDIATLTRALRDVMGVMTEARQEARDTVANLASEPFDAENPNTNAALRAPAGNGPVSGGYSTPSQAGRDSDLGPNPGFEGSDD